LSPYAKASPGRRNQKSPEGLQTGTNAKAPDGPLVATLDYVPGFPCITITPFAFYGEQTARLLQAVGRCLQSGKVDEIECCLLHALEPGRSLVFDWLVDLGFAHREDGRWLVWRSSRLA
jgi:hypothetical protein